MTRPPSQGRITARFGPRRNPVTGHRETHHGLDINSSAGRVLVAPERCILVGYGVVPGWEVHGRVARIQGLETGTEHWLSHTDRALARVGRVLAEGAPVAVMGVTGQTTGLHVHWETRTPGRTDPEAWLAGTASTPDPPTPITPDLDPEEEEEEEMATIIVERDDPQKAKGILDPKTGRIARELNGAAESSVWRGVQEQHPELAVFVEVTDQHYAQLLSGK